MGEKSNIVIGVLILINVVVIMEPSDTIHPPEHSYGSSIIGIAIREHFQISANIYVLCVATHYFGIIATMYCA